MAILADILGVSNNCGGTSANTGRAGCKIELDRIVHAFAVVKGYRIAKTEDLTKAFFLAEVQKGNIIPLTRADNLEDLSAEDSYITDDGGVKSLDIAGLPEFKLNYSDGHVFYREIAKLTSNRNFDYILGDVKGNLAFADFGDEIGGFEGGHLTASQTTLKAAGAKEMKSVTFQLLDRTQYDQDYEIITSVNLGWSVRDIDGVNAVKMSFSTAPAGGTTVNVKVLLADGHNAVSGLDETNFFATVDGADNVITAAVETGSTGVYALTLTDAITSSDKITVGTFDGSLNTTAINLADALYRGSTAEATVV